MKHIYWYTSKPHCENYRLVKQVDGKVAFVCEHNQKDTDTKTPLQTQKNSSGDTY